MKSFDACHRMTGRKFPKRFIQSDLRNSLLTMVHVEYIDLRGFTGVRKLPEKVIEVTFVFRISRAKLVIVIVCLVGRVAFLRCQYRNN